jgi:hypothetical protein
MQFILTDHSNKISFSEKGGKFMICKSLFRFCMIIAVALFSYGLADAQIKDAVKDTAKKTKKVTKKAVKTVADKSEDVVDKSEDVVDKTVDKSEDVVDKSKDVTVDAAKKTGSGAKKFGKTTVSVTEKVAGQAYEGGRWLVVTTWDGAKWVSKKVWFPDKDKQEP